MAGTVHNATVCRVNDELPVIVFCLKPPRKDMSSSLSPLFTEALFPSYGGLF